MTKKEFIALYSEKGSFKSREDAQKKLDIVLELFGEILARGEEVNFIGWGRFEVINTSARKGRNPKTGEEVSIKAKKVVKFRPGKVFKNGINSK